MLQYDWLVLRDLHSGPEPGWDPLSGPPKSRVSTPHLDQVRTPLSLGQEKVPLDPGNLCAVSFFARLARFVTVVACWFGTGGGGTSGAWIQGGGNLDEVDRSVDDKFEGEAEDR